MVRMDKIKKVGSYFLVALYISFYANTFSFNHSHVYSWGTIVHSHPYATANHTHAINALHFINSLSNLLYLGGSSAFYLAFFPVVLALFASVTSRFVATPLIGYHRLRAPPIPV